jgi:hypothetical protein
MLVPPPATPTPPPTHTHRGFAFTLEQDRSTRTMNTVRAEATTAVYFLAHDVLVLRELTQFENKRFGRIPGFAKFLNVTATYTLQPGLHVALWIGR